MHDAAVPFLDPDVYGRSPLENSSFIASSANPDPAVHGRGFVARLSGSTAEFLHIWQLMFFGRAPFTMRDGKLTLEFTPFVPDYLMPDDGVVKTTFLGKIEVVYLADGLHALVPGVTAPASCTLTYTDGTTKNIASGLIVGADAIAVRDGKVTRIEITMK